MGVYAQQVRHLDVFGAGAAGAAHAGATDELGQRQHGDEGHHEDDELHVGEAGLEAVLAAEDQPPEIRVGMAMSREPCAIRIMFCRKIDMPMAEMRGSGGLPPRSGR